MTSKGNSDAWDAQSDPFGEDFYLVPREEETLARAWQVHGDNRNAIRHFVELLVWEMRGDSDTLKILIPLLWHWDDIDPTWLAEPCFMSLGDVCDLAESQPLMSFPCLDCGVELQARSKGHRLQMHRGLQALCESGCVSGYLADLLCETCLKQRHEHAEDQRRLDRLRQQALLDEYRQKPYSERRRTQEWAILKKQVHRRDGYRCRLCGTDKVQLHVHHSTYTNYGQERLEDLITLCSDCHRGFHFISDVS